MFNGKPTSSDTINERSGEPLRFLKRLLEPFLLRNCAPREPETPLQEAIAAFGEIQGVRAVALRLPTTEDAPGKQGLAVMPEFAETGEDDGLRLS